MTAEPIQRGDTVRFNEAFNTLVEGEGKKFRYGLHTDGLYRNGEVLEVRGDVAVVDWNDVSLPREMKIEHLEKVALIAVGDTVRLTEVAYRAQTPSVGFKNGEVLEVTDNRAVIDWLDQALPREVSVEELEKVVRKKPAAGWGNKAAGIEVGDRVCMKASHLRSTGQFTGEAPHLRGEVKDIKPLGDNFLATVEWSKDYTSKVLTCNLSKVKKRGIADE
jgi:hypothetical protein